MLGACVQNVVGIGAGIVDGLGFGDNTKAAVIRLGLMEMIKFTEVFMTGRVLLFSFIPPFGGRGGSIA